MRCTRVWILAVIGLAAMAWPGVASAQSLGDRIESVQQRRADDAAEAARERAEALRDIERRLAFAHAGVDGPSAGA